MKKKHSETRRTASSYALMPLVLLVGTLAYVGAILFQGLARLGRLLVGCEQIAVVIVTITVVGTVIRGHRGEILIASVIFWMLIASFVLFRLESRAPKKFRPVSVKKTK